MKKKLIYGGSIKEQLKASGRDKMYKFILADGQIRGVVLNGTKLVNEMRANHELDILSSLILGYGYVGALLLSSNLKGAGHLVLDIAGDGPARGFSVEANAFGEVRGYLKCQNIPYNQDLDKNTIKPYLGHGLLSVTRYLGTKGNPFTGSVEIKYNSLAQNLAYYSLKSEQAPSSYSLSLHFSEQGEILGAGGLLLQVMPGADEGLLAEMQDTVYNLPCLGQEFSSQFSAPTFVLGNFTRYNPQFLEEKRVAFMCHCNKNRFTQYLCALDRKDKEEILEEGPFPLTMTCYNCNTVFEFSREELGKLFLER